MMLSWVIFQLKKIFFDENYKKNSFNSNAKFYKKKKNKSIGLVATLGGLHQGHLALITKAKKLVDVVIVSIFLNPLQFGRNEDLDCYPANLKNDLQFCLSNGVDYVFTPSVQEMYDSSMTTVVSEKSLTHILCGQSRPYHFDGVATVVAKLYNAILPNKAFFGEKDYQQLCVIKRLSKDLNFPVEVISVPIIREKNGLAFSTRNQYLSLREFDQAAIIFEQMNEVKKAIQIAPIDIEKIISDMIKAFKKINARIDYVKVCDYQTLKILTGILKKAKGQLFVAIFLGKTRLIDNMFLD